MTYEPKLPAFQQNAQKAFVEALCVSASLLLIIIPNGGLLVHFFDNLFEDFVDEVLAEGGITAVVEHDGEGDAVA